MNDNETGPVAAAVAAVAAAVVEEDLFCECVTFLFDRFFALL